MNCGRTCSFGKPAELIKSAALGAWASSSICGDCALAQTRIEFHLFLPDLFVQPTLQFQPHRCTVLLMVIQVLLRIQCLFLGLQVQAVDFAKGFQDPPTFLWKRRMNRHKLAPSVTVAISQDGCSSGYCPGGFTTKRSNASIRSTTAGDISASAGCLNVIRTSKSRCRIPRPASHGTVGGRN